LGKYQSCEPRHFIATADSQRFAAYAARSPDVSAARHPCHAAIGHQKRFSANGDRRRSNANSDRRTFGTIGWMVRHGVPTMTFGAGQNEVHTIDEWINLDEYDRACALAVQLATMW
jgi:acetylornithine deacetylase/succinyl-diaminopimelate desuccinylase-like protein